MAKGYFHVMELLFGDGSPKSGDKTIEDEKRNNALRNKAREQGLSEEYIQDNISDSEEDVLCDKGKEGKK